MKVLKGALNRRDGLKVNWTNKVNEWIIRLIG